MLVLRAPGGVIVVLPLRDSMECLLALVLRTWTYAADISQWTWIGSGNSGEVERLRNDRHIRRRAETSPKSIDHDMWP